MNKIHKIDTDTYVVETDVYFDRMYVEDGNEDDHECEWEMIATGHYQFQPPIDKITFLHLDNDNGESESIEWRIEND